MKRSAAILIVSLQLACGGASPAAPHVDAYVPPAIDCALVGTLPCQVPPPALCLDHTASNFGQPLPCVHTPPPVDPNTLCQSPTATNVGQPLPCVFPPQPPQPPQPPVDPTTLCQDHTATNFGHQLPCTYPPAAPTTCQDHTATNFGSLLPCTYPAPPALDVISLNVPGSVQVNQPLGLLVTVMGTTNYASFAWTFDDGSSVTVHAPNTTHTYLSTGTYSIGMTFTDALGRTQTLGASVTVTP